MHASGKSYPFASGDIITHVRTGTIARCAGIDSDGVRFTGIDGFTDFSPACMSISTDKLAADWRLPTPEESAWYKRVYADRTCPNYY